MNPYEVLGVQPTDDAETIKKAYKELVKKYHPDKYINNPLADLAAEKMKEINKAYDMITNKTTDGNSGSAGYGTNQRYGGYDGVYRGMKPTFTLVRQLLNMRRAVEAQAVLEQLPKTAEWYYLSAIASIYRGWHTQGIKYMEQAVSMDPDNAEYRDTLNNLKNRTSSYTNGGGIYSTHTDCCTTLPCMCIPCVCSRPCYC